MIPIDQDIFGAPHGNCFTACVASILEVPLKDLIGLQNVYARCAQRYEEIGEVDWRIMHDALLEHGHVLVDTCSYAPCDDIPPACPIGYSIASGKGPRGLLHCCVALDGAIVHDPHPDRSGLNTIRQYDVLIPARPLAREER